MQQNNVHSETREIVVDSVGLIKREMNFAVLKQCKNNLAWKTRGKDNFFLKIWHFLRENMWIFLLKSSHEK